MPHIDWAFLVSSRGFTSMPCAPFLTSISSGHVKESSPFGPFIFTAWPSTVAVTPAGTTTGFLPMRDIVKPYLSLGPLGAGRCHEPPQNTLHKISPPTFSSRARESDITPLGVDRMATPNPFATLVRSRTAL